MYASLFTFQLQPGHHDELLRLLDDMVPEARKYPGLQAGYLLKDPNGDKVVLIGFYDTEVQARAAGLSEQFTQMHRSLLHAMVPESVERRLYEVARVLEVDGK